MIRCFLCFLGCFIIYSCHFGKGTEPASPASYSIVDSMGEVRRMEELKRPDSSGQTISTRFSPPPGFVRPAQDSLSFAHYLRNIPLRPAGAEVHFYDGQKKPFQAGVAAVVKLDVGNRDLQQCADAVMRLRAEYLYRQGRFSDIHFNLTNGFEMAWDEWRSGKRLRVKDNRTWWEQAAAPSDDYASFRKYLDWVFMYAGTWSLERELEPVAREELAIGDVFIQGGSPGHAVMVVDRAVKPESGEVVFLLAQSYMPAQDIHVLNNLEDKGLSPWYALDFGERLQTPEWSFGAGDLRRFAGGGE